MIKTNEIALKSLTVRIFHPGRSYVCSLLVINNFTHDLFRHNYTIAQVLWTHIVFLNKMTDHFTNFCKKFLHKDPPMPI